MFDSTLQNSKRNVDWWTDEKTALPNITYSRIERVINEVHHASQYTFVFMQFALENNDKINIVSQTIIRNQCRQGNWSQSSIKLIYYYQLSDNGRNLYNVRLSYAICARNKKIFINTTLYRSSLTLLTLCSISERIPLSTQCLLFWNSCKWECTCDFSRSELPQELATKQLNNDL